MKTLQRIRFTFLTYLWFLPDNNNVKAINMFIQSRYRNYITLNDTEPCYCNEVNTVSSCIESISFYFENLCYSYFSFSSTVGTSETYKKYNDTHICIQSYSDQFCQNVNPPNYEEEGCSYFENIINNPNNDCEGLSERWLSFDDFCVDSSTSLELMSQYTIPIHERRLYPDITTCVNQGVYSNTYVPIDPTHCWPNPTTVNNERVAGSIISFCESGNILKVDIFSDVQCLNKDDGLFLPELLVEANCQTNDPTLNYRDDDLMTVQTSSCGKFPLLFCQDLSLTGLGTKLLSSDDDDDDKNNTPDDSTNGLHFFIQRRFLNYTSTNLTSTCTCDEVGGSSCIDGIRYYVEDYCYSTANLIENKKLGSRRYRFYNDTHICVLRYYDQLCNVPVNGAEQCTFFEDRYDGNVNQCEGISEQWFAYEDFCMELSESEQPFTVPMIDRRDYSNQTSCQLGNDGVFINQLTPIDRNFCLPGAAVAGEQRIPGSIILSCEGDIYKSDIYSGRDCTEKDPNLSISEVIIEPDCNTPSDLFAEQIQASSCGMNPNYYCRDLSLTEFGVRVGGNAGTMETNGKSTDEDTRGNNNSSASHLTSRETYNIAALVVTAIFFYL